MPIDHLFLDMDGVLADFFGAALAHHERSDAAATWPKGVRPMAEVLGIEVDAFWAPIEAEGQRFWAELEPLPWAYDLIALAREQTAWSILTSPRPEPGCVAGKVAWIERHVRVRGAPPFRAFHLGSHKDLLAAPGRVLIDDSEEVVERFEAAGGTGLLFPQVWNRLHAIEDPMAYVRAELERLAAMPSRRPPARG